MFSNMKLSPFKSKPDKSNEPGLFIGVHIDFAEFRIAILSEEWKGVEEKKAITSDHPIEIPKISKESENLKLLFDTIGEDWIRGNQIGSAGKYSHGETNEEGSGYAIARNILNEAISNDFSDDVGGEFLLEKIRVHFGLANPRDIVRLMNQSSVRRKLASFARSFNPIKETDPLDVKIRDEFDKAGETITYDGYLTNFDNAKKKKMAIFLIGFRPKHFKYFHFKKLGSGQLNIKWYGLDEELDNPEVAAAYFASSLVLGEPLNSLNVKHYANSYDVQNGIVLDNKMLP
ncbi:hypothetical protein CAEBREN_06188 [Caenorhabditis brenneri]|uniref:Uncharacterized protein n=1 Tax=Caenorhabditis brenneri TaxID=135651 RepID=G0NIA2_CAEBE|nr:hypothetical protein CAEBREN_06188 [Caenorhabditis brenneri]